MDLLKERDLIDLRYEAMLQSIDETLHAYNLYYAGLISLVSLFWKLNSIAGGIK